MKKILMILIIGLVLISILFLAGCSNNGTTGQAVKQITSTSTSFDPKNNLTSLLYEVGLNQFEFEEKIDKYNEKYLQIVNIDTFKYNCDIKVSLDKCSKGITDVIMNNVLNRSKMGLIFLSSRAYYNESYYVVDTVTYLDDTSRNCDELGAILVTFKTTGYNIDHYWKKEISASNYLENIEAITPLEDKNQYFSLEHC